MGVDWLESGGPPTRSAILVSRDSATPAFENSLEAFQAAELAGADGVKVELTETACGSLVLVRDEFVVHEGSQLWVRDLSIDQLAVVLGRQPETHQDALDACTKLSLGLYTEIKSASAQTLGVFADSCRQFDLVGRVCVASARSDIIAFISWSTCLDASWLVKDKYTDPAAVAQDTGCRFVHPCVDNENWLVAAFTGPWMERLWSCGRGVVSWNTNNKPLIAKLSQAGFAAIHTDDPANVLVPDTRTEFSYSC